MSLYTTCHACEKKYSSKAAHASVTLNNNYPSIRLSATDVMNPTLRYMYPITRVYSVQRLLRTTAHSAFVIVTPVDTVAVPKRPQNVSDSEQGGNQGGETNYGTANFI